MAIHKHKEVVVLTSTAEKNVPQDILIVVQGQLTVLPAAPSQTVMNVNLMDNSNALNASSASSSMDLIVLHAQS